MLNSLFAYINENAPIIVCGLLLIVGALFTVLMCVDNARHRSDQATIANMQHVIAEADKEISRLRADLKTANSNVFAARTDCKRECKRRDTRIANLEHKVNQLTKVSK